MRPTWRYSLGVAAVAVLAATAATPNAFGQDVSRRPIVGSAASTAATAPTAPTASTGSTASTARTHQVTLITGDVVVVEGAGTKSPTVTVLPREDGTVPTVETRRVGNDVYVYPEDAAKALAEGKVDEELFNVTGLVAQGYDDASTKTLPVITTYTTRVDTRSAPATPQAATKGKTLRSIDGVAMKADKGNAAEFFADVTDPSTSAGAKVEKVWLDRKVSAMLDRSTKQIHADQAWALGLTGTGTTVAVLDTGADAEHPDLKGRIVGSQDFTGSYGGALDDEHGHGTHTASTVGGSGAASDGLKKGVAPGTGLLIGKVLDDYGSGSDSGIISGMEWAVAQHADVVSMSLGQSGTPGDCTDPLATAAQHLSETSSSLFVIAAGNSGPANNTVSSPACAPAVLSVGAVDRDDSAAQFSSRGPAAYTHTLKPEISAPGVAISAARAGGRGDNAYVSMSGTSMATPHVAGAAAIVKQAHPDWTGSQLKAALVSSSDPNVPGDVRASGAGRVDVKAALDEEVTSEVLQAGTYNWPHTASQQKTLDVPYTNLTNKDVTLTLAVAGMTGDNGSALKFPAATLGATTVTVPAGAKAVVPMTVNPAVKLDAAQYGDITGRVVAKTADGKTVTTPFAMYVQPQTVTLKIRMTDRLGNPAAGASSVDVINTDSPKGERRSNNGAAEQVYAVRPGTYLLSGYVQSPDGDKNAPALDSIAYFARPEITISGDTTIDFDARKAHLLSVKTDRPSVAASTMLTFTRLWDGWIHAGSMLGGSTVKAVYADVQGKPQNGTWEFGTYTRRYAPAVQSMSVVGGATLHPTAPVITAAGLDGTSQAPIVDAGAGTATDLTAAKVKDKVALVRLTTPTGNLTSAMANLAKSAGAKALLLYRPVTGQWAPSFGFPAVPVAAYSLPMAEGDALKAALAAAPGNELTLTWNATARSPYVYNLGFTENTPLTDDKTYVVHDKKLGSVEATYTAMGVDTAFVGFSSIRRPDGITLAVSNFDSVPVPGKRTELFTDGGTQWKQWVMSSLPFGEAMEGPWRSYPSGSTRTEQWHGGVIAPIAIHDEDGVEQLTAERQGELMGFAPQMYGDGFGHVAMPGSFGDAGSLQLKRDGVLVGTSAFTSGVFEVPAEDSLYELTMNQFKFGPSAQTWKRSTQIATTWAFRSHLEPDVFSRALPLLFPRVGLPEDGLKTLAASGGQQLSIGVSGHAGYTPGDITDAKVAWSYDGGTTWTDAAVANTAGAWTATVDHTGASGKTVTLKVEVTDSNGAKVTQVVTGAYAVR